MHFIAAPSPRLQRRHAEASSTHTQHGFTLIELLVVISIIALLIAILLPALNAARTTSHRAVSLSNSRQILIALNTYAVDFDSSLPPGAKCCLNSPFWTEKLAPREHNQHGMGYIQDISVFWSPGRNAPSPASADLEHAGYAGNLFGAMSVIDVPGHLNMRLARFGQTMDPDPARLLVTMEAWDTTKDPTTEDGTWRGQHGRTDDVPFTYQGAVTLGFFDGHAAAHPSDYIGWEADSSRFGTWISGVDPDLEPWFEP